MAQVVLFLTTPGAGSWTVPADFTSTNTIECIGGGGGGGNSNLTYPGGGGGAYAKISNLSLTPGATITVSVGAGGGGGGSTGGDTWFNGASLAAASVGAKGGTGGYSGGTGGAAAASVGTTKYSGGNGATSGPNYCGGGGGAAGLHGPGSNGAGPPGNGGDGDVAGGVTYGGAGGVGSWGSANPGSPGYEWTATSGARAGSGGGGSSGGYTSPGAVGGLYGGGGSSDAGGGKAGAQGVIVITYDAVPANEVSDSLTLGDSADAIGPMSADMTDALSLADSAIVDPIYGARGDSVTLGESSVAEVRRGSTWTSAIAAILAGDTVNYGYGVEFRFASETISLWQGVGRLDATAFAGPVFQGIGALGRIASLELGAVAQTEQITFELSGLQPSLVGLVPDQASEVKYRVARLWFQFFDAEFNLIDARPRRTYLMDRLIPDVNAATDPPTFKLTLTAEPRLATKNQARFSYLTDADQRARHSGDRILERVGLLSVKQTMLWL